MSFGRFTNNVLGMTDFGKYVLTLSVPFVVAGAVISGAVWGSYVGYQKAVNFLQNVGTEIYNGQIEGQQVVYTEGVVSWGVLDRDFTPFANRMTVTEGDTTFVFEDSAYETSIGWQATEAPEFGKDILEKVTIIQNGIEKVFYNPINAHGKNSLEGEVFDIENETAQGIFAKANERYNTLRSTIRQERREEFKTVNTQYISQLN